jgi:hypothetical protein
MVGAGDQETNTTMNMVETIISDDGFDDGFDDGNSIYMAKRPAEDVAVTNGAAVVGPGSSYGTRKKRHGASDGGIPFGGGVPGVSGVGGAPFSNGVVSGADLHLPKKKRTLRKMKVSAPEKKIWDRLMQVDSGLTLLDWVCIDKTAKRDLQAGLRYLLGRRSGLANMEINNLSTNGVDGSDTNEYSDSDGDLDSDSDAGSDSVSTSSTDESLTDDDDGSVACYKYSYGGMKTSSPFRAPIVIGDQVVSAIFDTGASVSLISSDLVQVLGLVPNGDRMALSGFDGKTRVVCDIVMDVPVRVGGKLRAEHMCVHPSKTNFCLLGMTWFQNYGIKQDLDQGLVYVPTGGNSYVEVKGGFGAQDDDGSLFGVIINQVEQDDGVIKPSDGDLNLDAVDDPDLRDFITKNKNLFVEVSGHGIIKNARHDIQIKPGSAPVRSKPYRLTWEEDNYLKKELKSLLELGIIKASNGMWASPVFFVKKKTNDLRMVVDYRGLNEVTVKDAFPLPRVDELLDSIGGAKIFSTMDAANGFWQVPLTKDAQEKSGFVTKYGTFTFAVLAFGMCNGPSSYQKAMTNILGDYIGDFVLVFIDDIIVYSRNKDEHIKHLALVMDKIKSSGLKLKFKKCNFMKEKVEYLGHMVTGEGILPTSRNVEKIQGMKTPTNVEEVRSFLGCVGYYRRFFQNYGDMVSPIQKLVKKTVTFQWGEQQQLAFDQIKEKLISPPILAFFDPTQKQILITDASSKSLGCILGQRDKDGKETVIGYGSKTLQTHEQTFGVSHLEAYAVVWAVQHFRHYLQGRNFLIKCDHSSLKFIFGNENPSPKVARWASLLMEYDYDLEYIRGKRNPADALSRLV